jgi:hypothetical protein
MIILFAFHTKHKRTCFVFMDPNDPNQRLLQPTIIYVQQPPTVRPTSYVVRDEVTPMEISKVGKRHIMAAFFYFTPPLILLGLFIFSPATCPNCRYYQNRIIGILMLSAAVLLQIPIWVVILKGIIKKGMRVNLLFALAGSLVVVPSIYAAYSTSDGEGQGMTEIMACGILFTVLHGLLLCGCLFPTPQKVLVPRY